MSDAALRPDVALIDKLSPSDLIKRAAQIAPAAIDPPHKQASCITDVWFSAFFDGTSNSLYDEESRPHDQQAYSNVARLFMAHTPSSASQGVTREYLQGVGTQFPQIGDAGGVRGAATGYMGMERIDWAEKRLKFAIDTQRSHGLKINTVHVAVFGFSRGATLARAFVNRLAKQAKQQNGQWTRDGARFRIYFVGVFDTVASVGMPREHNTYAKELGIPAIVERCVHMVAAHELRFAFPLDSVRRDAHYPSNTVEYVYPGVHSDVGGGYAANEQGRSNAYAKLPLNMMYREAQMAGVPLVPVDRLPTAAKEQLRVDANVLPFFRAYMSAFEATGSSVEEQMFGHLKLYWRWRKLRMNNAQAPVAQHLSALSQQAKQENSSLYQRLTSLRNQDFRAARFRAEELPLTRDPVSQRNTNASQEASLNQQIATNNQLDTDRLQSKEADSTLLGEAKALSRTVSGGYASAWEKAVWEAWNDPSPLAPEVAAFFDNYIHDSQAAWNHSTDAAIVAMNQIGAAQTCGHYFTQVAAKYCSAVEDENRAATVQYLRPRTLFFGAREAVFSASDTKF